MAETWGGLDCRSVDHAWAQEGGRACPNGSQDHSQAVLRCSRCGEYDYGDIAGPCCEPAAEGGKAESPEEAS